MSEDSSSALPPEMQIALAHTQPSLRNSLRIFFELDLRLARIVAATNEPMLGQMRLSWWREMLEKNLEDRPKGDAVLDGIGTHWLGHESALIALVNGWEQMLAEELTEETALEFANGRAAPFEAIAQMADANAQHLCLAPARRWALTDTGLHVSDDGEREIFISLARQQDAKGKLPKSLRGLAILDALAMRSLKRGGAPLMEGRGASLTAFRAAIFRR